jgi:hypothetical protein
MEFEVLMTGHLPLLLLLVLLTRLVDPAAAHTSTAVPIQIGDVTVSGSLRTRVESWD